MTMKNAIIWDVSYVALVRTDALEEFSASIIRVTRICKLGTLAVTSNECTLRRNTMYFSLPNSCHPDDGGAMFLQNIGSYKSHMAQNPRRWHSLMLKLSKPRCRLSLTLPFIQRREGNKRKEQWQLSTFYRLRYTVWLPQFPPFTWVVCTFINGLQELSAQIPRAAESTNQSPTM
jgi:hypothetical protein